MTFVKWTQWDRNGLVTYGTIHVKDIGSKLRDFEIEAKKVLADTGADHVLYAVKFYDKDDNLVNIHFHMYPMTDREYDARVASMRNVVVYALHRR